MSEITDLLTPALVVALFAWLRADIRKLNDRLDAFAKSFDDRLDAFAKSFDDRLDATAKSFNERLDALHEHQNQRFDAVLRELAELRERMARMEGALEGFLAGRRDRDAA